MLVGNKIYYLIICLILLSCSGNEDKFVRRSYYDTGELRSISEFNSEIDTLENGSFIGYYKKGNIRSKGLFKNGKEEGRFSKYYEDTGDLEFYITYKNGIKQDSAKWYYNNSRKLDTEFTYNHDQIDGVRKSYYESGMVSDSSYYINGLRQGNRILYHENGKLKMYFFYNEIGEMSYKRTYHSNGEFKAHYGGYFGSRQVVDKPFYNVDDTLSLNLYVAKPIDLDYKLYCIEKDENKVVVNKKQIYLDRNIYRFKKIFKKSDKVIYTFVIEFPNQDDRQREELELIVVPDGLTELELNHDKEVLSKFKVGEVY